VSAISHRFVAANGLRFHVAMAGDPRAPLVVLLHGFPELWRAWRAQLVELGRDRFAIAPDQRGYNLSDKPEGVAAYKAQRLVEDVAALAATFTDRKFVLAGHDWGGAVAWNFAIAHPERLEKLVIVNAPHPVPFARSLAHDPAQRQASAYMNVFRGPGSERLLAADGCRRLTSTTLDVWGADGEERAAYLAAWSQPGALRAMLDWYRASPLHPPTPDEAGASKLALDAKDFIVRVPTLVIWGMRDQALLPCLLDGLEECVPDLRIERIEDGSHWVVHEQPERVNVLLRAFLDQRPRPGPFGGAAG
jgi:pimeloyl-ACP methyl ester carboxylesterase